MITSRVKLLTLPFFLSGYQDPYRARLTSTEAIELDLAECMEGALPYCTISNRGLALIFPMCPRLSSLTIRHAPYITRFPLIDELIPPEAASSTSTAAHQTAATHDHPQSSGPSQIHPPSGTAQQPRPQSRSVVTDIIYRSLLPLKSLTLENCPGITVDVIEKILTMGEPFGFLECLVLREMFPLARQTTNKESSCSWLQRWLNDANMAHRGMGEITESVSTQVIHDSRKLGLLLCIADLLSSRLVGYPPLSPVGVGMGASVRDVSHYGATTGMRLHDLPVQPFDVFFKLTLT